ADAPTRAGILRSVARDGCPQIVTHPQISPATFYHDCGASTIGVMDELDRLFEEQRGVATSGQILCHLTRRGFEAELKTGNLERIWQGIYCRGGSTDELRLRSLDLCCGTAVPVCLGTAAALH